MKKPFSIEMFASLKHAYLNLSEKHKRHFIKIVNETTKECFRYWVKHTKSMLKGIDYRKVLQRELTYGTRLDKSLWEIDDGEFAEVTIGLFLSAKHLLNPIEEAIVGAVDRKDFEEKVDAYVEKISKETVYALLLGNFVKCYGVSSEAPCEVSIRDKMLRLHEGLGKYADDIVSFADDIRVARDVDPAKIQECVASAGAQVIELKDLLSKTCKDTGLGSPEWNSTEELLVKIEEASEALDAVGNSQKISDFLKALSESIKKLRVQHPSKFQQNIMTDLRDESVVELKTAADKESPEWVEFGGLEDPSGWFSLALDMELDTQAKLMDDLAEKGYPKTAGLIHSGNSSWLLPSDELAALNEEAGDKAEKKISLEKDLSASVAESEPSSVTAGQTEVASDLATKVRTEKKLKEKDFSLPPADENHPEPELEPPKKNLNEMWSADSSKESAKMLVSLTGDRDALLKKFPELIWNLVAEGSIDIAYHLTRIAESVVDFDSANIKGWVWELLYLAPYVESQRFDIQSRMQELILEADVGSQLFEDTPPRFRLPLRLVLVACGLRPSIMAPGAGTSEILTQLHFGEYPELHNLLESVVVFSRLNIVPESHLIDNVLTEQEWREAYEDLQNEIKQWCIVAPSFKMNWQPANQVWKQWLKSEGFIGKLMGKLSDTNAGGLKTVLEIRNKVDIDELISTTKTRHLEKVDGAARRKLSRHAEEVLVFADKWVELMQSRPGQDNSYARERFRKIKELLSSKMEPVLQELKEIKEKGANGEPSYIIAAGLVEDALKRAQSCMEAQYKKAPLPPNLKSVLNQCLLRFPSSNEELDEVYLYNLHGNALKPEDSIKILRRMVRTIADDLPDYEQAFELHCKGGNLNAAEKILDILETQGDQADRIEEMQIRLDDFFDRWEDVYGDERLKMEGRLGDAMAKTQLSSTEFKEWSDKLQMRRRQLEEGSLRREGLFFRYIYEFVEIDQFIEKGRSCRKDEIQNRLKKIADISEENYSRILDILNQGDLYLANDYIDRLEEEGTLIDNRDLAGNDYDGLPDVVLSFGKLKDFKRRDRASCLDAIRTGGTFYSIDFSSVAEEQRREYVETLGFWFDYKPSNRRRLDEKSPETLLQGLGFGECRVDRNASVLPWFCVETDKQVRCPVPQFGSEAKKKYYVQIVAVKTTPENLLNSIDLAAAHSDACIVFYRGQYSETNRRRFSHACRERKKTVLLVDDLVMVALASGLEDRVDTFFKLTLPYTYLMPYSTTASLLPREMFYGRQREVEALLSIGTDAAFFLYGGRQIGKTVLLRHVEQQFHNPEQNRLAKYLALNVKGLGLTKKVDELWAVLVDELKHLNPEIFTASIPRQMTFKWFEKQIRDWLSENSSRRILLLLDEADDFLAADGKGGKDMPPFSQCTLLKALMENTERHFKVVFAGLHNVQRSTRVGNNPLAHFGTPICIGPMLRNGEARAAMNLIRRPMGALGVFFESPDYINSILARTNYYPNLIQIYCQNLLRSITDTQGCQHPDETPPYRISAKDVDSIYLYEGSKKEGLRNELREKFRLTLDLDRRFSLIAHLLALYEADYPEGMTVSEIRSFSMDTWRAGFKSGEESGNPLSYEGFINILEEMQGLGILRKTRQDKFGLRSPNVAALLGTEEAIYSVLESAESWEVPPVYEAEVFRSLLDADNKLKRSVFTAAQEGKVKTGNRTLTIVTGHGLSGLEYVQKSLAHCLGEAYVLEAGAVKSAGAFSEELKRLAKRHASGKSVMLVTEEHPWDMAWVDTAAQRLQAYSKDEAPVGVVFVADGQKVDSLVNHVDEVEELGVSFLTLEPWHDVAVRQWLEDSRLGKQGVEVRRLIYAVTGNWHANLMQLVLNVDSAREIPKLLEQIENDLSSPDVLQKYRGKLQIPDNELSRKLFSDLAALGGEPLPITELEDLINENISDDQQVRRLMLWASMVGLAVEDSKGWMLDCFASRILLDSNGS